MELAFRICSTPGVFDLKGKRMAEREYLRIKINGLGIYYNILPDQESAPVMVGLGERESFSATSSDSIRLSIDEENAFQKLVLRYLDRLEAKLDELLHTAARDRIGKSYQFSGDVVDIGGGGISFKTVEPLPVGVLLDFCLAARYGNPRPVFAVGDIAWIEDLPEENGENRYLLGVQFSQINEDDRKAIVRLVFQTERKQRQHHQL